MSRRRPRSESYWRERLRYLHGRLLNARINTADVLLGPLSRQIAIAKRRLARTTGQPVWSIR